MLSLRAIADELAAADSLIALGALARRLGFTSDALPLDRASLDALGIGDEIARARIAAGPGVLRALIVSLADGAPVRERVSRIAARLSSRAPQLLWLVLALDRGRDHVAIATWSPRRPRPRITALLVDRARVLPSDAETIRHLAAAAGAHDVLTHARWLDVLGRDALTRRFFRELERVVRALAASGDPSATEPERDELALLTVSRLMFLSFLESKGWLDGDPRFLERGFADCMVNGGGYHRRVIEPLVFGTLNTPVCKRAAAARALGKIPFLNGGLFARSPVERRHRTLRFPDDALGVVFGDLLTRYRFTARENDGDWSEAAVDPEMLGKAFESLMASRERRVTGAYYTPQPLVARLADAALAETLSGDRASAGVVAGALRGEAIANADAAAAIRASLSCVRVLDPACGSGAFLVYALERLAALATQAGDSRAPAVIRRELLARSIFGVDINPTAVWLCELRLWLSVVIESEPVDCLAVPPLPNLDRNICVGDSLGGAGWDAPPERGAALALGRLRERYARATGARKHRLQRELDRRERAVAMHLLTSKLELCATRRRDLLSALRGRDLFGARRAPTAADRIALAESRMRSLDLRARRRTLAAGGALPFSWSTRFADVAAAGGFDLVVGNPPWVRLHRVPPAARVELRARFSVFARSSWARGAHASRAGTGFAAQIDVASLFIERSVRLAREGGADHSGGVVALLVPSKLWHALAAGGVRRLLADETRLLTLEDWSESPNAFDAAVYPSTLIARRSPSKDDAPIAAALHRRSGPLSWSIANTDLTLDAHDAASPWLVVPQAVREAWDRVRAAGPALADSALGAPQLGVKCGCNEAFIVRLGGCASGVATVRSGDRVGAVEHAILRPLLRGESIAPWTANESGELILWTHGPTGTAMVNLPPHAERWLGQWRSRLTDRTDARHSRWWSLFRTAAASDRLARVVWADVGREPRALVLDPGDASVPLNSCYVLPCRETRDAYAVAAILNSPLAAAWLDVIAEPARGGYRRYLGWTVGLLPMPNEWPRARDILAPIAERAALGLPPHRDELLDATLCAYDLRARDIAPLLTWTAG